MLFLSTSIVALSLAGGVFLPSLPSSASEFVVAVVPKLENGSPLGARSAAERATVIDARVDPQAYRDSFMATTGIVP